MSGMYGSFRIGTGDYLSEWMALRGRELHAEIEGQSESYILNVNEAEYSKHLVSKYEVDIPRIDFDDPSIDAEERMIPAEAFPFTFNVYAGKSYPRTVIVYHIPYSGDATLLRYKASTFSISATPEVYIKGDAICTDILSFSADSGEIKRMAEHAIDTLRQVSRYTVTDLERFNAALPAEVAATIARRKQESLKKSNLLASLGVPIRKQSAVPQTFSVPIAQQHRITFPKPQVHEAGFKPEPALDPSVYAEILRIIHDAGKGLERLPSTYAGKEEEDLRDHLIMLLEPHFRLEGSVTGETFNRRGKTDILIRHQGNNVFIAECKFWGGAKKYHKTLDQIFKYLTWRDSKAAVVLFDRNSRFTDDLATIEAETPKHPNFLGFVDRPDDTWFNFRLHVNGDPNREVKLAVLSFHLPPIKLVP